MTPVQELRKLGNAITGTVLLPSDADYETARHPWNRATDQRPAAIAYPTGSEDITLILKHAAAAGLGVTVQPHGHGANGSMAGCVLVRPTAFTELSIDTDRRVARVGAGVDWGTVLTALEGTGLIALAGSNPTVNAVGYSIAGGHSAFSRRYGLAAHSIVAVELVLASGEHMRVDAERDPELFWALRGGGGLFGVIVTIEFSLYPATAIFGGKLTFPGNTARNLMRNVFDVIGDAPDELSLSTTIMNVPDAPFVPEPVRGKTLASVDVVYLGEREDAEKLIAPLRGIGEPMMNTTTTFTIGQLAAVADEPTEPAAVRDWAGVAGTVDAGFIDSVVEGFTAGTRLGLSMFQIRPLGGAIRTPRTSPLGAVGAVTADAVMMACAFLTDPMHAEAADEALQPIHNATASALTLGGIPTFLGADMDLSDAYDQPTIDRLHAVKQRVDPSGTIRSNRPLGKQS